MTIDKLEGIRGNLVRTDHDWQEWEFPLTGLGTQKVDRKRPPEAGRQSHGKASFRSPAN